MRKETSAGKTCKQSKAHTQVKVNTSNIQKELASVYLYTSAALSSEPVEKLSDRMETKYILTNSRLKIARKACSRQK